MESSLKGLNAANAATEKQSNESSGMVLLAGFAITTCQALATEEVTCSGSKATSSVTSPSITLVTEEVAKTKAWPTPDKTTVGPAPAATAQPDAFEVVGSLIKALRADS